MQLEQSYVQLTGRYIKEWLKCQAKARKPSTLLSSVNKYQQTGLWVSMVSSHSCSDDDNGWCTQKTASYNRSVHEISVCGLQYIYWSVEFILVNRILSHWLMKGGTPCWIVCGSYREERNKNRALKPEVKWRSGEKTTVPGSHENLDSWWHNQAQVIQ